MTRAAGVNRLKNGRRRTWKDVLFDTLEQRHAFIVGKTTGQWKSD
jgi:hypothetical protein